MNEEKQRIAIAEACGWKPPHDPEVKAKTRGWFRPEIWFLDPNGELEWVHKIPDYLNDLNAMHEAEKVLKDDQRQTYFVKMAGVLVWADDNPDGATMGWLHMHATAKQRAEAFLKTIGKWEEA
jgi:hypothetical protein